MTATSNSRDPLAVLDAIRPEPDLIDQLWPTDHREAALQRILTSSTQESDDEGASATGRPRRVVPLRTRTRTRVALAATLTAVAASAAVFGLLPGSETPAASAFAGYRLTPTPMPADAQEQQAQTCREDLLAAAPGFTAAQRTEIGSAPLVAADTRGDWNFTVLIAPDPERSAIGIFCLQNPQRSLETGDLGFSYPGATEGPRPDLITPMAPGSLQMSYGFGYYTTGGQEGALGEFGRVGPDVTAVQLQFPGGTTVEATVQDGWYAAWWPVGPVAGIAADETIGSYAVTTPAGVTTITP